MASSLPCQPSLCSMTSNFHQQGSKASMTSVPDVSPPWMIDDRWCPLLQHRLVLSKHLWRGWPFPISQWFNHWRSLQRWTVVCSLSGCTMSCYLVPKSRQSKTKYSLEPTMTMSSFELDQNPTKVFGRLLLNRPRLCVYLSASLAMYGVDV